uniref:Protein SDA1 n=1 Tax=Compsopogon caeruleus TaxID=31354 RepID=A0A7S1XCX0_9RHOD|mmetsp:Transcript_13651/g.27965  ORF Transcript_13651/g.27965 Transcript_13651/m.27965 type:complete len:716 (+) Transcript_13651:100-2247(+)|eukprot:CAMPEP_0184690380 /NCGR_PEP_ID=MMETSP0312-20130426/31144_1 /TAXON_ID=31354 /ORGANISM="Compsopogon coeruleus, Strain SAG 36.94" /LENGTH=715 /DNA_ID=CAMNT_0027147865 /DNA_START=1611 /DNA_END=3758 /DNA_ORIENTATION=+
MRGDGKLEMLQSRCRKDPRSYQKEYEEQVRHLEALLEAAALSPGEVSHVLEDVVGFVSSLAALYSSVGDPAGKIMETLGRVGEVMNPSTRRALVRGLGILRARGRADGFDTAVLYFRLLRCHDKALREQLRGLLISDLKSVSKKTKESPLHRKLQGFLFGVLRDPDEILVKRSLLVVTELFRRKIWNDARTANVIASACFHDSVAVVIIAVRFIIDSATGRGSHDSDESSDSDEDQLNCGGQADVRAKEMWNAYNRTARKNSRKKKRVEKAVARLRRKDKDTTRDAFHDPQSAIFLINDPQDMAERLFHDLLHRRRNEKFDIRLSILNLLTRLIGAHQLIVLNLYPFLQRYMQPHQQDVTLILAFLAQSCHPLVPPDALYPLVRTLADNFVSDRCSPESIAAGLNSIRAICSRVPLAIEDPESQDPEGAAALLQDLIEFKLSRDKGVSIAARSLMQLYRDVNPGLLKKKDRGKDAIREKRDRGGFAIKYGQGAPVSHVPGLELLDVEEDLIDAADEDELPESEESGDEESEEQLSGEEGQEGDNNGQQSDYSQPSEDNGSDLEDSSDSQIAIDLESAENDEAGDPNVSVMIDRTRILDDDDFRRIRQRQGELDLSRAMGKPIDTSRAVDREEIESYVKKKRRTLEERLESIRAGQAERVKYGSKLGRREKTGGTSNREKLRKKEHVMVIHKTKRKRQGESMRERQKRKNKQKRRR